MGYWITRFGASTTLPTKGPDQMIGPGPIRSSLVRLPGGGVYDTRGSDAATQAGQIIPVSGICSAATAGALKTAYDLLRAIKGDRDKLYRSPDGGSANSEWMYARCVGVSTRRIADNQLWVPITLSFELQEQYWHGADGSDTITLAASPQSGEITNDGNTAATQIVLTITATTAAISAITIENEETGHISKITYAAEIAIGKALVIDCGAKTVLNDGANAFSSFSIITATHTRTEWLVLKPGNNTIKITKTGGHNDNTATFAFDDAHK